jgi:flagellar basal body-associated protein FliL
MSATTTEEVKPAAETTKSNGGGSMLPVLAVVVLVPVLCYVTTQYLLIPKLKGAAGAAAEHGESGGEAHSKKHADKTANGREKAAKGNAHNHEFGDVVVNLSGAKGTRFLRARFTLSGSDPHLEMLIKSNDNELRDLAIGVLSAQTMESLEAPGARNAIRNELISQFNHALQGEVIEQIYFTEFVVQ